MKKFGMPTKDMYLIPFLGGIAVGDILKSRWQDVYISTMSPVYGLIMTVAFYVAHLVSDSHFASLVALTSALLSLFCASLSFIGECGLYESANFFATVFS